MTDTYCRPVRPADWFDSDVDMEWDAIETASTDYRSLSWLVTQAVAVAVSEAPPAELEQRFRVQAEKWERETQHLSSPTQKTIHPSYQAILGMGAKHKNETIRLLLLDLQENRRPWFWALSYLAEDNPISPSDAGRIDKMIAAWIKWGRAKGFL